jgi:hypothetical protein
MQKKLPYQTHIKDIDPNFHIHVFFMIKANGETFNEVIIILIDFTFKFFSIITHVIDALYGFPNEV